MKHEQDGLGMREIEKSAFLIVSYFCGKMLGDVPPNFQDSKHYLPVPEVRQLSFQNSLRRFSCGAFRQKNSSSKMYLPRN